MTTNTTSVLEQSLLEDPAGPVLITEAHTTALVVTEPATGNGVSCMGGVIEQTLLVDPVGMPGLNQVVQLALEVTDPAPGPDAVSIRSARSLVLLSEPNSPGSLNQAFNATLLSVEKPDGRSRASRVTAITLIADLDRGVLGAGRVANDSLIVTEKRSADPRRFKIMSKCIAIRSTYRDPATIISDAALISIAMQRVDKTDKSNPVNIMSDSRLRQSSSLTVLENPYRNPLDFRQFAPTRQLHSKVAVNSLWANPQLITAPYRSRRAAEMVATATSFAAPTNVHSTSLLHGTNILSSHAAQYPESVSSDQVVFGTLIETAHTVDYLDPRDPALIPRLATHQTITFTAHNLDPFDSPEFITSMINADVVRIETAANVDWPNPVTIRSAAPTPSVKSDIAHPGAYLDPEGIKPSRRAGIVSILAPVESPNYNSLPTSPVEALQVRLTAANSTKMTNPIAIKPSCQVYATYISSAYSVEYEEPDRIKPKRRIQSDSQLLD